MRRPRIAFVGSGGATKGVAHVGVLRAIEELGLDVDIFVGASAGAIASAYFSQGYRADDLIDWFRPFYKKRDSRPSLTLPRLLSLPNAEQWKSPGYLGSGMFSADNFERFVASTLPVNDFRALDKHVLVTATDIDGRGRVVFGRGHRDDVPISQAVAASSCVPILFRPHATHQILRDDVPQQRCLPRSALAQHQCLHDACIVIPEPGFPVHVIAEHNRALRPRPLDEFLLATRRYGWQLLGPGVLAINLRARRLIDREIDDDTEQQQPKDPLNQLPVIDVPDELCDGGQEESRDNKEETDE